MHVLEHGESQFSQKVGGETIDNDGEVEFLQMWRV